MVEIINVDTQEKIEKLKLGSALTFEGCNISQESLNNLMNWIKKYTEMKTERVYVISGNTMNTIYNLTGNNAYPDDLHIVCIDLDDMVDFNKIIIPRFSVGGRWLDDVINNNLMREGKK